MKNTNEQSHEHAGVEWLSRPSRELRRLSWPIAVSMISYATMTLADTLFVGQLGSEALAGVGLAGTASWITVCFGLGLLRGSKVLVSQRRGEAGAKAAESYLSPSLLWALILTLGTSAAALMVIGPLENAAGSPESAEAAASYYRCRMFGFAFLFFFVALREVRYGLGDSRTPMVSSLIGNTLNIVLDYVFIVVLSFGVEGAAWATVIAQGFELLFLCGVQVAERRVLPRFDAGQFFAIWKIGFPTGAQFFVESGAFLLLTVLISKMGDTSMSAHVIALQVVHFAFLPMVAVADGASVMAGQALGAREADIIPKIASLAMKTVTVYALLFGAMSLVLGRSLAEAFSKDPAVVSLAVTLLGIAAVFVLGDGVNIVARGVLRGTGDVRFAAVLSVVIAWVCTPPLAYLFGYTLGLGVVGGWLALLVEISVGASLLYLRMKRKPWLDRGEVTGLRGRMRSSVSIG